MGKFVCANNGDEVHYLTFPCPFYEKITNSLLISSHNNDENLDIEQRQSEFLRKILWFPLSVCSVAGERPNLPTTHPVLDLNTE